MKGPTCPGCRESELTYGRELCQACKLLQTASTDPVTLCTYRTPPEPPPNPEPADDRERLMWAATALAERGWHVFPCQPGGKRPVVRDWERRATTDTARIARCWTAGPYNIGIACGPSRLVVIDLDKPKAGQAKPDTLSHVTGICDGADVLADLCAREHQPWPSGTFTVTTPSGGIHMYYNATASPALRNTAARLGWLIDTRATGGYVLGPGSVIGRNPYAIADPAPPGPLPAWLAARLADDPAASETGGVPLADTVGTAHATGYALAALRGEVDRVLAARLGSRNATLNEAAFALGQLTATGILPDQLARDALRRAAAATGLPPREAARTIGSGLTSGARQPRQSAA